MREPEIVRKLRLALEKHTRKPSDETLCWKWEGAVHKGYGRIKGSTYEWPAHRAAYRVYIGEIPEGKHVTHRCGRALCVNPAHLELADPKLGGRQFSRERGQRSCDPD